MLSFTQYLSSYKRALEKAKSGVKFVTDQVRKHKEDIDYDSPPRDYTDSYLIKIKEQEAVSNSIFNGQSTLLHRNWFKVYI